MVASRGYDPRNQFSVLHRNERSLMQLPMGGQFHLHLALSVHYIEVLNKW